MRPYFFAILPVTALLAYLGTTGDTDPDEAAKLAFSIRAEAFASALSHARANGLAFEVGRQAASTLAGHERAGTNIPGGRLWFDQAGGCHTENGGCANSEITLASDASRIYTITFDGDGSPVMVFDDFY